MVWTLDVRYECVERASQLHSTTASAVTPKVESFLATLPSSEVPRGEAYEEMRLRRIRHQIPPQDRKPSASLSAATLNLPSSNSPANLEGETREATRFQNTRNRRDFGIGRVERSNAKSNISCAECSEPIGFREFCIRVRQEHRPADSSDSVPAWHPGCFRCSNCSEHIVDFVYGWVNGKPYCLRHYGQMIRPRCATCDHKVASCLDMVTNALSNWHTPLYKALSYPRSYWLPSLHAVY
ncbi:hypothetical protein Aperf_G00000086695 [Anoplocephala perfoliata]